MNKLLITRSFFLIAISHLASFGQPADGPPCPAYCGFKTYTFKTDGKRLLDPCGSSVVLKGVNKMVYFDGNDPEGARNFPQIASTGANCVRIAWQMRDDITHKPTSTARLDRIITNARANKLIPIIGLWDYTNTDDGGFSKLNEYVAYWKSPAVRAVIQKHRTSLIINIANEAARSAEQGGDETNPADLNAYANAYKTAVRQLRQAGIEVPLMIDGLDRGKSLHCFAVKGPEIVNDDPKRNIIFSFHAYWPKADTDAQPTFIRTRFKEVSQLSIPIIIGELSKYGAWTGDSTVSPCSEAGLVDYVQFAQQADALGMGWLIWEWGPGNQWHTPNDCRQMDMTSDGTAATIGTYGATSTTPAINAWAKELTITAPYSLKNTAQRTFFINSSLKSCPND
ncbi:hypothetical protein GCM10028818_23560 [Spirosoma horti]